jgi:hypothetical protein
MDESLPIIRVLLGELHHFSKDHRDVLHDVFKPMRSAISTLLTSQQKKPRRSADFEMLIDMLEGVIFIDSLRRSHGGMTLYSAQHCLDTAVEMMLSRLQQMKGASGASTRKRKRAVRR